MAMRLGGGIGRPCNTPEEWMGYVKKLGYSAVVFPLDADASKEDIADYCDISKRNDLIIGEVGAWSNPLSLNENERKSAMEYIKKQLALADDVGASCCVNISGARGEIWDGCYKDNYSHDTYAMIVEYVREIIDAVKPTRTFFTLECMPWMYPDSPENYLQLLKDIDRPAFAVHLDFVNMINSVDRYLNASEFIKSCYQLLGPHIKSVHGKDVFMSHNRLPCNINEVAPGKGIIDYELVLKLTRELGDVPLFTEHLETYEEYYEAASYIRKVGEQVGIKL